MRIGFMKAKYLQNETKKSTGYASKQPQVRANGVNIWAIYAHFAEGLNVSQY